MNQATAREVAAGWQARLELGFAPRLGRTALLHRKQRGPLAVPRPIYPEGETCHTNLLHPPGGVVGGDSLQIQCQVADGAHALVTTPGATKFYRSAGARAEQKQSLQIAAGARLEWLPQENIFFPGAITRLQTKIELSESARFIGWEVNCLGLPANSEHFDIGQAEFQLIIKRDDQPFLIERLTVTADKLHAKAGLRGLPVNATLLATRAGATELEQVRELLAETPGTGVTLIDDVLVVRYLGDSTERCRNLFIKIWAAIRTSVMGRPPCPPRIWST